MSETERTLWLPLLEEANRDYLVAIDAYLSDSNRTTLLALKLAAGRMDVLHHRMKHLGYRDSKDD